MLSDEREIYEVKANALSRFASSERADRHIDWLQRQTLRAASGDLPLALAGGALDCLLSDNISKEPC